MRHLGECDEALARNRGVQAIEAQTCGGGKLQVADLDRIVLDTAHYKPERPSVLGRQRKPDGLPKGEAHGGVHPAVLGSVSEQPHAPRPAVR